MDFRPFVQMLSLDTLSLHIFQGDQSELRVSPFEGLPTQVGETQPIKRIFLPRLRLSRHGNTESLAIELARFGRCLLHHHTLVITECFFLPPRIFPPPNCVCSHYPEFIA